VIRGEKEFIRTPVFDDKAVLAGMTGKIVKTP